MHHHECTEHTSFIEELLHHVVPHTLEDTLITLPILFLTYLLIEFVEHRASQKFQTTLQRSNKYGPILGGALGVIPQCGFSVMASNLFSGGIISLGTLMAIFISTSDELIPVMLADPENANTLFPIIAIKLVVGIIVGISLDLALRNSKIAKHSISDVCKDCNCHKDSSGIVKPALKHTLKVFLFILIVSFALNALMEFLGEEQLHNILMSDSLLQPYVAGIIGLIPSCVTSVIVVNLFAEGILSLGALVAALTTSTGMGLAVLIRINKNVKENLFIIGILYLVAVIVGTVLHIIGL